MAGIVLPVYADEAKTIVVPEDYPTIQEAINRADPGDTVYVKAGQYNGSLVIKQSIALIGQKGAVINSWVIDVQPAILVSANNVTVKGITIDNPSASPPWKFKLGIHLLGASNCTISNNIVTNCDREGIWLYQSANNTVEGNTVYSVNTGIDIGASTNNIIRNNSVRYNWIGINLYNSAAENTISGNDLDHNQYGLYLSSAFRNMFSENEVFNSELGVDITDGSYGNMFIHNNFDNSKNVESTLAALNVTNTFDNGKEGNYYNDYNGVDADGNGIGDSPFIMVTQGADITDHYPLMNPWTGDNLPPVITVLSPQNATLSTGEVSLNFTVNKTTAQIKYSLNGAQNVIVTGNFTLTELPSGNHTIVIYATGVSGVEAQPKTVAFTVALPTQQTFPILIAAVCAVLVAVLVAAGWLLIHKKRHA